MTLGYFQLCLDPGEKKRNLKSLGTGASRWAKSARDSANQVVNSDSGRRVKSVGGATFKGAQDVSTRIGQGMRGIASQSRRSTKERVDTMRQIARWDAVTPGDVMPMLKSSLMTSADLNAGAKRRLASRLGPVLGTLSRKGMSTQAQAFATVQSLLASEEASTAVNGWIQGLVSGTPTIYDRAMDATYNATHIGGGLHRMFDGSHTIPGAFQTVRDASPDDSIFEEAAGYLQALARDATTPMGLPLVNWDQDAFYGLADSLGTFGIPRDWLIDMVNYDAAELAGASIGIVAVALNWNNEDVEEFSKLVGGMGFSAAVGANPLLLIVTVVALARAFHTARKSGDWKEFTDGLAKGGICTGAVLLTTSVVGGPAVVVLLTGICVGIVANRATANVSVVEIGQFVIGQVTSTTTTTKSALESASRRS